MESGLELNELIRLKAMELGFEKFGIAPGKPVQGVSHLQDWIEQGYAGQMHYMENRIEAYQDPNLVLDQVQSVIMLCFAYNNETRIEPENGFGAVSRYAWGIDYHDVIKKKLHQLCDYIREVNPNAQVRGIVDTAPLLEREYAHLAGLGWIGKNTMLIDRNLGSWLFIAAVLTDQELPVSNPYPKDYCGTCRACLDACPTDAFEKPFILNANRCISYTTIEHRGPIELSMRDGHGSWLYGCDICQDVCPWNRKPAPVDKNEFLPIAPSNPMPLHDLFLMDESEFRKRFKKTPIWRTKRQGLLRNAAIVLGNQADSEGLKSLRLAVNDSDEIVREAAIWALNKIACKESLNILKQRANLETNKTLLEQIQRVLQEN